MRGIILIAHQDHPSSILHRAAWGKLWFERQNGLEQRENELDSRLGARLGENELESEFSLRIDSDWLLCRFHFKLGKPTPPLGNVIVGE